MSNILQIEATSVSCSVAFCSDGDILYNEEILNAESRHSELLGVLTDKVLKKIKDNNIDAISLSSGPGSYTGLRIGSSLAKGLAMGWDIPIISVDTLELMAYIAKDKYKEIKEGDIIKPMIDARRMEVYTAEFDFNLSRLRDDYAQILNQDNLPSNNNGLVYCVGNGSEKIREMSKELSNIIIDSDLYPLARYMYSISNDKYEKKEFVDIAYFEPNYLKEYVAIIGKNKVLGN